MVLFQEYCDQDPECVGFQSKKTWNSDPDLVEGTWGYPCKEQILEATDSSGFMYIQRANVCPTNTYLIHEITSVQMSEQSPFNICTETCYSPNNQPELGCGMHFLF